MRSLLLSFKLNFENIKKFIYILKKIQNFGGPWPPPFHIASPYIRNIFYQHKIYLTNLTTRVNYKLIYNIKNKNGDTKNRDSVV